jgi:hypothetical protein
MWNINHSAPSNDITFFTKLPSALQYLPNLTYLSISDVGEGHESADEWARILLTVPLLQELVINRVTCGPGQFGLFVALSWNRYDIQHRGAGISVVGEDNDEINFLPIPMAAGTGAPLCRGLQSITIFGMDAADLDIDNIIACLHKRRLENVALRVLHFRYSTGITDAHLEALSEFVDAKWEPAGR